jgi:hypothetical protein
VPIVPPISLNASKRRQRDAQRRCDHDRRMAERERESHAQRPLAFLHQLARHRIDRGDVVGVDRVPQAEAVCEQRGAEQQRVVPESDQRPCPCGEIGRDQRGVQRHEFAGRQARARSGGRRHE